MMKSDKEKEEEPNQQKARAVKARSIMNKANKATIPVTGKLEAPQRIEVYAEVQGLFIRSDHHFKTGVRFQKGDILVQIDKQQAAYNLRSQKSNLKNSITQMLPDLKIDYPQHFDRWKDYLKNIKLDQPVPPLPQVKEQQVDYFISARNIYSLYNTIKAQQQRLKDFTIRAPFDGVLTEDLIERGTLVRPGQKLGEFIQPERFELQASLGANELPKVDIGDTVTLHSNDISGQWQGELIRINKKINANTQSVQVTIATKGESLKEGMYLEGSINTGAIPNTCQVPRRFIEEGKYVWVIRDQKLAKAKVQLLHSSNGTAIVRGLRDGIQILNEAIPAAYEGMRVKPVKTAGL
jgi:membrane fusion protein (multidrug efflux system)